MPRSGGDAPSANTDDGEKGIQATFEGILLQALVGWPCFWEFRQGFRRFPVNVVTP